MKDSRQSTYVRDLAKQPAAAHQSRLVRLHRQLAKITQFGSGVGQALYPIRKFVLPDATVWFPPAAGAIFLVVGVNSALDVLNGSQVWSLADPLSALPWRCEFLIFGSVAILAAVLLLLTKERGVALALAAWLPVYWFIYRGGLWIVGGCHPWVFVGDLTESLNISPILADAIMAAMAVFIFVGSAWLLLRIKAAAPRRLNPISVSSSLRTTISANNAVAGSPTELKTKCPACYGKIAFAPEWTAQTIPCPHCGKSVPLNPPQFT